MADVSGHSYTIEERLVASVWVHERQHTGQTMTQIMGAFQERFNKAPPRKATLIDWDRRAFTSGSVKDRPRSGRKKTREETCATVCASIEQSPMKSTRKRASELGIPRTTMRDYMKKDLKLRPFRPTFVNELSDRDRNERVLACRALLTKFPNAVNRAKVMFSDECAIYRSSRARNVVMWAKENPHYTVELERNPPHVMIWAAMTSQHLLGPYFFEGTVNGPNYLHMLQTWLIPQLEEKGLTERIWLQQDGAPAHYALAVREFLNEHFPGRWIGRGSVERPAPLKWPPRSPDLSTPDNSLWGVIKEHVSARRYATNEELRNAVEDAFRTITPDMLQNMSRRTWRRMKLCLQHDGEHTDILDT